MLQGIPALMVSRAYVPQNVELLFTDYKFITSAPPALTHTFTNLPAGALITIAMAQPEDGFSSLIIPSIVSSPVLFWSKRVASTGVSGSGNTWVYQALFTAGGNITITCSYTSSVPAFTTLSSVAYVFKAQVPIVGPTQGSGLLQTAPDVAITTTRDNAYLIVVSSDWNAVNGSGRVYRNSEVEDGYSFYISVYTAYHYHKVIPIITSSNYGLTTPSTMQAGTSILEVKGIPTFYAIWNIGDKGASIIIDYTLLKETGNLSPSMVRSDIGKLSGKHFWEYIINQGTTNFYVGIANASASLATAPGIDANGYSFRVTGFSVNNNVNTAYGSNCTTVGTVIGVAFDATNGTLEFFRNGVSMGVAFAGIPAGTYYAAAGNTGIVTDGCTANFGNTPFSFSVPTGYNVGLYYE